MNSVRRLLLLLTALCLAPFHPVASAKKVSLGLYYESLCPYSADFIVNDLAKIFDNGLIDIVDVDLVPFGNARVGSNDTIKCQHGPFECLLNTVEGCAIGAWPDLYDHFRFIYCVENLALERKYQEWETCFEKIGLDSHAVLECFSGEHGKKLDLHYASKTDSLEPPHQYVPWVVVDGEPLYEDFENFEAYICKAYDGELPKACKGLAVIQETKVNQADRVCHNDEVILPSSAKA